MIRCEDCKFREKDVLVTIREIEIRRTIDYREFGAFCRILFKPVHPDSNITACKDGESKKET